MSSWVDMVVEMGLSFASGKLFLDLSSSYLGLPMRLVLAYLPSKVWLCKYLEGAT
jgi:hypothetical protein